MFLSGCKNLLNYDPDVLLPEEPVVLPLPVPLGA